jgi:hypothetical protein
MPRARTHRIGLFAPPVTAAPAPWQEDEFTVVAPSEDTFVLSQMFAAGGANIVSLNGKRLAEGNDYTISGTTLMLLIPPTTDTVPGDKVIVGFNYV